MRLIDADKIPYSELKLTAGEADPGFIAQAVTKDDIDKMPTVSGWIPVTERMPEHNDDRSFWTPCDTLKVRDDWFCADGERKEAEHEQG